MSQSIKSGVEDSEEVDYQLGVTDIDMSASIAESEDDVVEFNYEAAAVFKRLADDIYESPEAGIREPLTNAITTTRKAEENYYGVDEPVITITAHEGEQLRLRLRDMGEGITKPVLNDILTVIGRSTARDDGQLSGQYGMGFLACYKLVGMNGGFIMCTNPRDPNAEAYSGLFKPGLFEYDNDNAKIPMLLDENDYGTIFEFFVKPSITMSDIREWVEKHSRFSSVPIIYREINEDGEEVYNEDFYSPNLTGTYGELPSIHIETPFYEATTSPAADNEIVLISSPVTMRGTRALRKNLPWSCDIRLKYEDGIVVKGPNKGLVPVPESQYESLSDNEKQKYVSEKDLTGDDLRLPESTGTRERLRKNNDFLRHVNQELREKYLSAVKSTLDSFEPSEESMSDLDGLDRHILFRIFNKLEDKKKNPSEYTVEGVQKKIEKYFDYEDVSEELAGFFKVMVKEVKIVTGSKTYKSRYPKESVYDLAQKDKSIYMCVSTNSWKINAVNSAPKEAEVISVKKASEYDEFETHIGWKPLKTIKKSNAEEILNISEELLNEVSNKSKQKTDNTSQKQISIHYASGGRQNTKYSAESTVSRFKNINLGNSTRFGDVLVLFPHNYEYNVSDYYYMAEGPCSVCACSFKTADYLTENAEGIMLYEDYVEFVKNQEVLTTIGEKSLDDIMSSAGEFIIHPKKDIDNSLLTDSTMRRKMLDKLKDERNISGYVDYGLINADIWKHVKNVYSRTERSELHIVISDDNIDSRQRSLINEVRIYASFMFSQDELNSKEVRQVINNNKTLNREVVAILESLKKAMALNSGEFESMKESKEIKTRYPIVKTKHGEMPFDELYNIVDESDIVVHPLPSDRIELFEDENVLEFGGKAVSRNNMVSEDIPELSDDAVYVPMLEPEFNRIKEHISDEMVVVSHYSYSRQNSYDITDGEVYAMVNLNEWNTIPRFMIRGSGFETVKSIVDSLKHLHDAGESLEEVNTDIQASITMNENLK